MGDLTRSADPLAGYRSVWDRKPVLRVVYDDLFRRIAGACAPGLTLEIGGGSGNLKGRLPQVIASDIQFAPWLDLVADAQRLPFADGALSNMVMVDVLHHIEYPLAFFREAGRALRPGGRIVMIEPAITPGSTLFYRLVHEEPVDMSADPLAVGEPRPDRNPYESNQAIPTLIATRHRERFHEAMPGLRIADVRWFSFAVYPLSGGFKPWSLVNGAMAKLGLKLERWLEPALGRLAGFRMMLVIEKR
ncbi:MAG TPA: class I SAM-dependent methyltransferase [Beijerinckiaceae bacterium]|jgi:SAM-dependent methyltransferase